MAVDYGSHEVFKMTRQIYEITETLSKRVVVVAPGKYSTLELSRVAHRAYSLEEIQLTADNSLCGSCIDILDDEALNELCDADLCGYQHILHDDIKVFLHELACEISHATREIAKDRENKVLRLYVNAKSQIGYHIEVVSEPGYEAISIQCGKASNMVYLYRQLDGRINSFPSVKEIEDNLTCLVCMGPIYTPGVESPFVAARSIEELRQDVSDYILSLHDDVMAMYVGSGYGGM